MATTILADNGVSSGAAGLKSSADSTGVLALQTTTSSGTVTTAVTVDNAQNVGVGVTPSAWFANSKAIEVGAGGAVEGRSNDATTFELASNAYLNSAGNWTYKSNARASLYSLSNGTYAWNQAAAGTGAITFTQAMTLDASGNLLVGATSFQTNTPRMYVTNSSQGTSANHCLWLRDTASNPAATMQIWSFSATAGNLGSSNFVDAYYNGLTTLAFRIASNGNVTNLNNSYGAISDIKLKENITDATPKLEKLNQVRVVNYNFIGDQQKQIGVIAQELEEVFPGMVEESIDRDAEGNDLGTTTKSVKYSVFVPMLIKAIQEQQALITNLTERLVALEGK